MVGTNDVLEGREADIQSRYQTILAKIPANIEVVMSSIPPVGNIVINGRKIDEKDVRNVVSSAKTREDLSIASQTSFHFSTIVLW